jgi:hypothetical protein
MRAGYNQAMILGIIGQQDQLNIRALTNYRRYLSMLNTHHTLRCSKAQE